MKRPAPKPAENYVREFDRANMVEVEPGWFVNEAVWAHLTRYYGVVSCTKKQED